MVDVDNSIYRCTCSPSQLAWAEGSHLALSLHLLNEPGELWELLWS